jgi:17 kDa outer membrane surface antigen
MRFVFVAVSLVLVLMVPRAEALEKPFGERIGTPVANQPIPERARVRNPGDMLAQNEADDASDQRSYQAAIGRIMETSRTGRRNNWRNPRTGNRGTVTPTRTLIVGGKPCREYDSTRIVGGATLAFTGTACRSGKGRWPIREETAIVAEEEAPWKSPDDVDQPVPAQEASSETETVDSPESGQPFSPDPEDASNAAQDSAPDEANDQAASDGGEATAGEATDLGDTAKKLFELFGIDEALKKRHGNRETQSENASESESEPESDPGDDQAPEGEAAPVAEPETDPENEQVQNGEEGSDATSDAEPKPDFESDPAQDDSATPPGRPRPPRIRPPRTRPPVARPPRASGNAKRGSRPRFLRAIRNSQGLVTMFAYSSVRGAKSYQGRILRKNGAVYWRGRSAKPVITISSGIARIWRQTYRGAPAYVQLRANFGNRLGGWSTLKRISMVAAPSPQRGSRPPPRRRPANQRNARSTYRLTAYLQVISQGRRERGPKSKYFGSVALALCYGGKIIVRPVAVMTRRDGIWTARNNARFRTARATWNLPRRQFDQGRIAIWGSITERDIPTNTQLRGPATTRAKACGKGQLAARKKGTALFSARAGDRVVVRWKLETVNRRRKSRR